MDEIKDIFDDTVKKNYFNYQKVKEHYENDNLENIDIREYYKYCPVQKSIEEIKKVNLVHGEQLEKLHKEWHEAYRMLKNTKQIKYLSKMYNITLQFSSLVNLIKMRNNKK